MHIFFTAKLVHLQKHSVSRSDTIILRKSTILMANLKFFWDLVWSSYMELFCISWDGQLMKFERAQNFPSSSGVFRSNCSETGHYFFPSLLLLCSSNDLYAPPYFACSFFPSNIRPFWNNREDRRNITVFCRNVSTNPEFQKFYTPFATERSVWCFEVKHFTDSSLFMNLIELLFDL